MMLDHILGVRLWPILLAACGAAAIPFWLAGFSFELHFLMIFIEGPALGFLAVRILARYPRVYVFAGAAEGIFFMTFAGLFGLLTCYAAAAARAPLIDGQLLWADRWLGYDWVAYAKFCASHPWLLSGFRWAYGTNLTQPVIIGALLYWARLAPRFEKFVLANVVGVLTTAIVFLLFPATTAWTFLGQESLAARILPDLPITANSWLGDLMQIRAGSGRYLTRLSGIVAFPSFHCTSALLNVWAVWPVRRIWMPFALLNLIMIGATPIIGGHYVTDLIGGAVVALLTIPLVERLHRHLLSSRLFRLPPAFADGKAWPQMAPISDSLSRQKLHISKTARHCYKPISAEGMVPSQASKSALGGAIKSD